MEAGWLYGHKYGGHLASVTIMSCLANRQRLGWGHWLDIIENISKYSANNEKPTGIPSIWEPQFVRLLHECESIFDGSQDYAKGGVYWADLSQPITNDWFKDKILSHPNEHPRIVEMNSLVVFR